MLAGCRASAVLAMLVLAVPPARATPCDGPSINLSAVPGGRTSIAIKSPCRSGQLVSLTYADATYLSELDRNGESEVGIDCFAGNRTPIRLAFEDGLNFDRQPVTDDMSQLSKVAIVWTSSVDLDLHALEFAAVRGGPGDIWSGHPSSYADVVARGQAGGFLGTASRGENLGSHTEVYTFRHSPGERVGTIKMLVDFTSRGDHAVGDYCGEGRFAELPFKAYILDRGGGLKQLDLAFSRLPCGRDIEEASRYNSRLIPGLQVGR